MSLLPPCKSSLELHITRCNYQAYIWKHAHIAKPVIGRPEENGWTKEDDVLKVKWTSGDILPQELIDILDDSNTDLEDNSPVEFENDLDIIFEDLEEEE